MLPMNDYQYIDEKGNYVDYWELVNDNGELCREIERLQQENNQLKQDIKHLINIINKNDIEFTSEECEIYEKYLDK